MKAISYFSNGIGNFCMMMPALQAVASMTDDKKIDIVLPEEFRDSRRPAIEEICSRWPVIDRVVRYPREGFDPRRYDAWYWSPHSSGHDAVTIFRNHMRHPPVARPAWWDSLAHERDHYMEIARAIGYSGPEPKVTFPLADSPRIGGENGSKLIVGICNGAFNTSYWQKKRWACFNELTRALRLNMGAVVVGVGGENELKDIDVDHNFAGKLTITQTARVISQLDLLVTTDTGNMHIADALRIPIVALFGSTYVSKNGPRSSRAAVIRSGELCAPCQDSSRFMVCASGACMASITVGDAMARIKSLLRTWPILNKTEVTSG